MEPKTLLRKIRQKGFTLKPVGNSINIAPKHLLSEPVLIFFKRNKQILLSALYDELDEHNKKKKMLGHRVGTLQLCLMRGYGSSWQDKPHYWTALNKWVDQVLVDWNYDLEKAIVYYDHLFPGLPYTCKCGRREPFCSCGGQPPPTSVKCANCANFKSDEYGGGGIGSCAVGVEYTEEFGRRRLLFPNIRRRCNKFKVINSN